MPAEGMKIAEVVRGAICDTPIEVNGKNVTATASVGVISVPRKARNIDDLLSETHHVLYRSKRRGKNRVSFEGSDMPEGSALLRAMEDLRRERVFRAVLQPIFRLIDDHPAACELLSRSTLKAAEYPDEFFRLSLEADMSSFVEKQCLEACFAASRHLPKALRRHINISPATLLEMTVPAFVDAIPDHQTGLFCVEISQNQIVGDPSYLAEPLERLKQAGVLTAIEDISFGKNSLESLVLLEPDFVKIDRAYVTGIASDPARSRSLERMLKLAESLGMEVIAEGIESRMDLGVLKACGVKYGQGFLWGRPAPRLNDFAAVMPEFATR